MSDQREPEHADDGPEIPERKLASTAPIGVRLLWFAIAAAVLVLILQVAFAFRGTTNDDVVVPRPGELGVSEAIGRSPDRPVTVRGFVFFRKGFPPRLCSGKVGDDPRRCIGPFIDLINLDESRLSLRRSEDQGTPVAWVDEPIAVLGVMNGSSMEVTEILN